MSCNGPLVTVLFPEASRKLWVWRGGRYCPGRDAILGNSGKTKPLRDRNLTGGSGPEGCAEEVSAKEGDEIQEVAPWIKRQVLHAPGLQQPEVRRTAAPREVYTCPCAEPATCHMHLLPHPQRPTLQPHCIHTPPGSASLPRAGLRTSEL